MDWNALLTALGNSAPVILVLGYAWQQAEKRAASEAAKRDEDNRSWADRFAELAHFKGVPLTLPIDADIKQN